MKQPAVSGSLRDSALQKFGRYPTFHFMDPVFISIRHLKYVLSNIQLESETCNVMECCMFRRKVCFSKRTDLRLFCCTYLCSGVNHICKYVSCYEEADLQIRKFDCRNVKIFALCLVLLSLTDYWKNRSNYSQDAFSKRTMNVIEKEVCFHGKSRRI